MPDESVRHFATLLSAELETERQRSVTEMIQVESEFTRRGMFQSSGRVFQTAVRLGEGLVRYRKCVFERWTAYVRPRLSSLPDANRAAFVEAALSAMDAAVAMARGLHHSRPGFNGLTGPLGEIDGVGARERRLLEAEVNLYMTTPPVPPSQTVHVTTSGANSPVNVGSGSLNQQINSAQGMVELVTAIGSLLEAMAQTQQPELAEVREILLEAKEEAAKPSPNRLKIGSILAGAGGIVQTVAALQPAWEVVYQLARTLGLAA
jgi:hypothetical protein